MIFRDVFQSFWEFFKFCVFLCIKYPDALKIFAIAEKLVYNRCTLTVRWAMVGHRWMVGAPLIPPSPTQLVQYSVSMHLTYTDDTPLLRIVVFSSSLL